MKNNINLNLTYYVTQYYMANPLLKIIFVMSLTFIIRATLNIPTDYTNTAFCMEENPSLDVPRPCTKRVRFDPTIDQDDSTYYKNKIMRYKHEVYYYKASVKELKRTLRYYEEQHNHNMSIHVINDRLHDELGTLQAENRKLTRNLAIAKSELSRFGRLTAQLKEHGISFKFFNKTKK